MAPFHLKLIQSSTIPLSLINRTEIMIIANSKIEKMFLLRKLVLFAYYSWLFCFRRAVWIALLSVLISSLRLALSESGEGMEGGDASNATVCPSGHRCDELPVRCLNCTFDESCVYGNMTEAVCTPLESVECEVKWSYFKQAKFPNTRRASVPSSYWHGMARHACNRAPS